MADTRASLQQRLAYVREEYEAANRQISTSIDEVDRLRLTRKADRLLEEIAQVEQQIQKLNEPPHFRAVMIDSPYRGLEIFREQDAGLFFGRAAQVADLLAKVADTGFLAVLGASGSGKSSLVQAGLLHALKIEAEGAPVGSATWSYATLKPGARPLDRLVSALAALASDTPTDNDAPSDSAAVLAGKLALARELTLDSRAVLRIADLLLQQRPNARLVLIIDQAEELWTLAPGDSEQRTLWVAEQQQPFIERLLTAAEAPDQTVLVVLAMRADFFHRLLEYPALAVQVERHLVTVSPMQPDQLREVIEQPAVQVGGRFEPGLVDELIKQTVDREGALPLLQYTLTQLWAQRDANDTCTWAAFRAIGGVEGALAAKADAILKQKYTTPEQRDAVRNVLLRLVQPGDGVADTRRRVLLNDLVPAESSLEALQTLLQPLTNERLITTGRDLVSGAETVEVSHEALIRAWPTLSTWIGEARTDLRLQIQLDEAAHEWHKGEQPDDLLWNGLRLANAEAWLNRAQPQINARAQSFLAASQAAQQARIAAEEARRQRELAQAQALAAEQQRRAEAERERAEVLTTSAKQLRQRAIGLTIAFVIAAILGAAAIVGFVQAQQNAADSQRQKATAVAAQSTAITDRQQAQRSEAAALYQALVSDAQLAASGGDTDQALTLTLAAIDQQPNNPPPALIPIVYQVADTGARRRFTGHTDGVWSVAFSPDGKTALSASNDTTLRLWDVATGQIIRTFSGHMGSVLSVAFSPDGKTALSGSGNTLRLWDVATGQSIRTFSGHTSGVNSVAFSPDGKTALSGSWDKTLRLWDVATGQSIRTFSGHTGGVLSVAFSPDGKTALSGSADTTLRLWDVATGQTIRTFNGDGGTPSSVTFSPDGKTALSGGEIVRLWDIATGQTIRTFSGHTNIVSSVAFSPDGKTALSGSSDTTLRLWDVASGQSIRTLSGHSGSVVSVAFSPDGKTALSGSSEPPCGCGMWRVTRPSAPSAAIRTAW
jgi:sugar lactone lactonase YvrE/energy-coupling factor transporter ATP-binding protein EcfA2